MKITKLRTLSLIAILSCTAAWTVSQRARPKCAQSSPKQSAVKTEHDATGLSYLSSPSQAKDYTKHTERTGQLTSVQPASAIVSSQDGVVLLSADGTVGDGSQSSSSTNNWNQDARLRSDNTPNRQAPAPQNPSGPLPTAPSRRKQVVDLRGRIASGATSVRGTAISAPIPRTQDSQQQQGAGQTGAGQTDAGQTDAGQQGSPAWVDAAIPQELFERANLTPRFQGSANNPNPNPNPNPSSAALSDAQQQRESGLTTQPSATQPSAIQPSVIQPPADSIGQPILETPAFQVDQQAVESQNAPIAHGSGSGESTTSQSIEPSAGLNQESPAIPQESRVPGTNYAPMQAIPQWLNPGAADSPSTENRLSPSAPPSMVPVEIPPPTKQFDRTESPQDSSMFGGEIGPPETNPNSANSNQDVRRSVDTEASKPSTNVTRQNSNREVPTGLKLSPDQVIPNWIYLDAGQQPPSDPRSTAAQPQATQPQAAQPQRSSGDPKAEIERPSTDKQMAPSESGSWNVATPQSSAPTSQPQQPQAQSLTAPVNRYQKQAPQSILEPSVRPEQNRSLDSGALPSSNGGGAGSDSASNSSSDKEGNTPKTYVPFFRYPEEQWPNSDSAASRVGYNPGDFSCEGGPKYPTFDPAAAAHIYRGKFAITTQRPLVELWRPLYTGGVYSPAPTWFGVTNPMKPHFMVYGDARTAVGINQNAQGKSHIWSNLLNLDMDLQLTSTERIHAFVSPMNRGTNASGFAFHDEVQFIDGMNFDFNTLFFEGDAGALLGGARGTYPPFDLPFTFGLLPLVYQNGIWANDAVLGAAMALPARNSSLLKWSNFDATVFWATDNVTTDAFRGQDSAADFFGTAWFIDAYEGYIEADYAFVNDNTGSNRGYHNISMAFTRRYFMRLSNSVRYIINAGQTDLDKSNRTADGHLLLIENSYISAYPNTVVPYFNMFYGQGRPQSLARAGIAGGILNNTGINFETDGMTNYPTLDPTGSNTAGFAAGVNLMASQFRHQLVLEFAMLQALGSRALRNAEGDEYGIGVRYQKPLSNNLIFRTDHMVGLRDEATNIAGSRFELRWKF